MQRRLKQLSWLLGFSLVATPAIAQQAGEVSVSEEHPFVDISMDDWAYQSLLRLTNQYGCIAGYPNGTFQGDQPITRDEFAAGLNACLDVLIRAREVQQPVSSEEFEALQESMEAFQQGLDGLTEDLAE